MNQLIPLLIITLAMVPLLVFWAWMFREMLNNAYLTPSAKNYWTMMFVFFNVLTAVYYYSSVYRDSQR